MINISTSFFLLGLEYTSLQTYKQEYVQQNYKCCYQASNSTNHSKEK